MNAKKSVRQYKPAAKTRPKQRQKSNRPGKMLLDGSDQTLETAEKLTLKSVVSTKTTSVSSGEPYLPFFHWQY